MARLYEPHTSVLAVHTPEGITTMSSALEALLAEADLTVGSSDPSGLFDPLRTVVERAVDPVELGIFADGDEVAPATATATAAGPGSTVRAKAKRRAAKSTSSSATVRSTMALLDPAAFDALDGATTAPIAPASAPEVTHPDPVARPNGVLYHPRRLGGTFDVVALRSLRAANLHVLLYGFPGCGKTAMLEAAFGNDLITFEGHGDAEIGDLVGTYIQLPSGAYQWVDGPLIEAMRDGKVLFVDDATLTPSGVLARLYPAMDGRATIRVREHAGETVVATSGFFVVGAHNPGVPGAVLSEALASRFSMHVEVTTDLALARSLGVDHRVVRIAASLAKKRRAGELTWAPEMRELLAFKALAEALGVDMAVANLVGLAPEDEHADVLSAVRPWFADAAPLAVGSRA